MTFEHIIDKIIVYKELKIFHTYKRKKYYL